MNGQQAEKSSDCTYIPYQQTGYYSKTIVDYLEEKDTLKPFYTHPFSMDGIKAAIQERQAFPQQRDALVDILQQQYQGLQLSDKAKENMIAEAPI